MTRVLLSFSSFRHGVVWSAPWVELHEAAARVLFRADMEEYSCRVVIRDFSLHYHQYTIFICYTFLCRASFSSLLSVLMPFPSS